MLDVQKSDSRLPKPFGFVSFDPSLFHHSADQSAVFSACFCSLTVMAVFYAP